jgi:multiple sugar transport system substrate-binding protein
MAERFDAKLSKRSFLTLASGGLVALAAPHVRHAYAAQMELDFPTYQLQQDFGPWWKAVVTAYEKKNPDVKIKLTNAPTNDHHRLLTTRFVGGNPPDIVHMTARFLWGYVDQGFIAPLDPWISKTDILANWAPDQASMKIGGKTYALLMLSYSFGLFYNKQMLADAKVDVPKTLEEFVAAAKTLTKDRDGDGRVDQYGLPLTTAGSSWGYITFMHFHCGRDRDIVINGKIDSADEIEKTLVVINEIVASGASPKGLDLNPMRQLFWQGNAAMYIDGSWAPGFANNAADKVKNNWDIAPLPMKSMAGGPSNVLAIPKAISPERQEAVWRFIELAASPEWQQHYAEMSGNPPGRAHSLTDEARKKWPHLELFEKETFKSGVRSHMPTGFEKDFNRFSKIVTDSMAVMMSGATPRKAAEQMHANLTRQFSAK